MRRVFPALTRPDRLGLLFVLLGIGLPLLLGLGRTDMGSDEAIYSYAVERILETGEWLTPRAIPSDSPFFEKPPLKFWMVAGGMRAGVLPAGDLGMRLLDAIFGVVAFAYVYLLGVRLAGPVCGVTGAIILFAFSPIVFEHGLRSNNMEAPLVLAYAGGIFHFVRWVEGSEPGRRRRDALFVSLYFTLGFMTKFVAALFLPLVCGAALLARPGLPALLRARWRDWVVPAAAAAAIIAPWFVYQSLQPQGGGEFWRVLFGEHVYRRLVGVLVPEHLEPWHHYFTATWREYGYADALVAVTAGLVTLGYAAWRRGGWLARVILLWFLLPYAVMSLGTSKLLHYTYPFVPPLALGGGLACAFGLHALRGILGSRIDGALRRRLPRSSAWTVAPLAQGALLTLGGIFVALGAWTAVAGPVVLEIDGVRVFRNGSVIRPLVLTALCFGLTTWGRRVGPVAAVAVLLLVLPLDRYVENARRVVTTHHPLREIRDCVVEVQRTSPDVRRGVLRATGDILRPSYYYYMRHAGPWRIADPPHDGAALAGALARGAAMPVVVTYGKYRELAREDRSAPAGVLVEPDVAILLPGPFESCVPRAVRAGAQPIESSARDALR